MPGPALILIAFLAFISLGLPDAVLGVAWPSIRHTFGLPISQLGALLATSMVGYLASTASAGTLLRKLGVGRLLVFSSLLVVVSLATYTFSPSWPLLVAVGILAGLGAGAIDAGINTYAAAHFSPRTVTWLHASYGIGATLGPLTMTAVLSAHLSWRWGYAIISAALLAMTLLFYSTRKAWDAASFENRYSKIENPSSSLIPSPSALSCLRHPVVLLHILIFFIYTGVEASAGQWLFSLLTESRALNTGVAGSAVSSYWFGLTGGRVFFGLVAPHFRRHSILRFALALAPLACVLLWLDRSNILLFLTAPLLGFALAPIYPMLISATPDRVGQSNAHYAVGFQVSAAYLGIAAIPSAIGFAARSWTLEILAPVLLLCTMVLLTLHEASLAIARCATNGGNGVETARLNGPGVEGGLLGTERGKKILGDVRGAQGVEGDGVAKIDRGLL